MDRARLLVVVFMTLSETNTSNKIFLVRPCNLTYQAQLRSARINGYESKHPCQSGDCEYGQTNTKIGEGISLLYRVPEAIKR